MPGRYSACNCCWSALRHALPSQAALGLRRLLSCSAAIILYRLPNRWRRAAGHGSNQGKSPDKSRPAAKWSGYINKLWVKCLPIKHTDDEHYNQYCTDRLTIEQGEPPKLYAMDLLCHEE